MCCSPNREAVRAATHYHTRASGLANINIRKIMFYPLITTHLLGLNSISHPAPIGGGDRGPAAESEHLLSLRLPSKWPCHPYQGGHLYVNEKDNGTEDRALWDPRCDWYGGGFFIINNNSLGPIR